MSGGGREELEKLLSTMLETQMAVWPEEAEEMQRVARELLDWFDKRKTPMATGLVVMAMVMLGLLRAARDLEGRVAEKEPVQ